MVRFPFRAFLVAGAAVTLPISAPSPLNRSGDWGAAYLLPHPLNPGATLVGDLHGKFLGPAGVFVYTLRVTNVGPAATFFDIDST
jgi:hypothetical protein